MFKALVADPPWKFGDKLPGAGRGAEKHYPVLTTEEICRFPLPEMAPDSYLLLWRVASQPQAALDVVRMWGFVPKTEIVWLKRTVYGKRHFGMGRHTRASHETCILATRGSPKPLSRSIVDVFDGPVGRHSEKPDEFYKIVEQLCAGPHVELFARRTRPGWVHFGNEVESV